jgi:hypothetical protein
MEKKIRTRRHRRLVKRGNWKWTFRSESEDQKRSGWEMRRSCNGERSALAGEGRTESYVWGSHIQDQQTQLETEAYFWVVSKRLTENGKRTEESGKRTTESAETCNGERNALAGEGRTESYVWGSHIQDQQTQLETEAYVWVVSKRLIENGKGATERAESKQRRAESGQRRTRGPVTENGMLLRVKAERKAMCGALTFKTNKRNSRRKLMFEWRQND